MLTDDGGMSFQILESLIPRTDSIEFSSFHLCDDSSALAEEQKNDTSKSIVQNSTSMDGPALISECILDQEFLDFKQVEKTMDDPYDKYEIPILMTFLRQPQSQENTRWHWLGTGIMGAIIRIFASNLWREMQFC